MRIAASLLVLMTVLTLAPPADALPPSVITVAFTRGGHDVVPPAGWACGDGWYVEDGYRFVEVTCVPRYNVVTCGPPFVTMTAIGTDIANPFDLGATTSSCGNGFAGCEILTGNSCVGAGSLAVGDPPWVCRVIYRIDAVGGSTCSMA